MAVRLAPSAAQRPGKCAVCENPPGFREAIVDAGDRDRYGHIYVCRHCSDEIHGLYGFIRPQDAEKAVARVVELEEKVAQLEEELANSKKAIEQSAEESVQELVNEAVKASLKMVQEQIVKAPAKKPAPKKDSDA